METELKFDAVVIGEGVAGFSAAVTLARRGKRVAVISQNGGATSVSSGSWDFGPISTPASFDALVKSEPWKRIYTDLLVDKVPLIDTDEATALTRELSAVLSDNLKMNFIFHRPFVLPTSSGQWKPTFGAQKIQTACDREEIKNLKIGFAYDPSWRFQGPLIAKKLVEEARKREGQIEISLFAIDMGLKGNDWPLPHVAARLEQSPDLQVNLKNAIKKSLLQNKCDFILFPPLFLNPLFFDSLTRDLGVRMGECLSTIEPVAGFRLNSAIINGLKKISVPLLRVSQIQVEKNKEGISALKILDRKENTWRTVMANFYILATGKYFGGGIHMGYQRLSEPLFHLPLFYSREAPVQLRREMPWEREPEFQKEQHWEKVGVWLNSSWSPRGPADQAVYKNVVACGSLIGGVDFARSNIGLGFMAYSGRQSGISIS